MSLIDKLPLIRGWTWRITPQTQTLLHGQEQLVYQPPTPIREIGWLVGLDFAANDAYMGLRILMPGIDSGYYTFVAQQALGYVLPPPSGIYLTRYHQPNPLRTNGSYAMSMMTSAYPWPYYGPVRLYMKLGTGSTESYATGTLSIFEILIEDRNLFLKDLRKVYYGRWAPLMDLISHVPLLRWFTAGFEELDIRFEEKEKVEPHVPR